MTIIDIAQEHKNEENTFKKKLLFSLIIVFLFAVLSNIYSWYEISHLKNWKRANCILQYSYLSSENEKHYMMFILNVQTKEDNFLDMVQIEDTKENCEKLFYEYQWKTNYSCFINSENDVALTLNKHTGVWILSLIFVQLFLVICLLLIDEYKICK